MNTMLRKKEVERILTKDFLLKEYAVNKKTLRLLAKITGIGKTTIVRYLKTYNIVSNPPHRERLTLRLFCKDCGIELCLSSCKSKSIRCKKCNYLHLTKENNPNWQGGDHETKCYFCGTILYKQKSLLRKHNFCNHKCYGDSKQNRFVVECEICGKQIERTPAEIGHHIFCSINCRTKGVFNGRMVFYKTRYFRSSWEVNFAQWCDLSGIKWEYESKTFDLGYTTYTPNFYLPEFDLWIEIKGYWRTDAKKKFKKFLKVYKDINIEIFEQNKLEELGVI